MVKPHPVLWDFETTQRYSTPRIWWIAQLPSLVESSHPHSHLHPDLFRRTQNLWFSCKQNPILKANAIGDGWKNVERLHLRWNKNKLYKPIFGTGIHYYHQLVWDFSPKNFQLYNHVQLVLWNHETSTSCENKFHTNNGPDIKQFLKQRKTKRYLRWGGACLSSSANCRYCKEPHTTWTTSGQWSH